MKKLLLIAVLMSNYCFGQITLDQTYAPSAISAIILTSAGDKIAVRDTGSYQIRLYNPDYSLWKTITVPTYSDYRFNSYSYISDNLFNSDNSLEIVITYYKYDGSTYPYSFYKSQIIDESGSVIYDLGAAASVGVHYINGVYKLFAHEWLTSNNKIHSLPGTIPCGKCGSLGLAKPSASKETILTIPNPNTGLFKIDGAGELLITDVAGKKIYEHSDYHSQMIDISRYPAGIYHVSLNGASGAFQKQ